MNAGKIANQKLKEALLESQALQLAALDDEMNAKSFSPEYSESFKMRMNRLLKLSKKSYFRFVSTAGKRAASFAVILLLSLTVTTFSVKALREPTIEFIIGVYEKFSSLVFGTDDSQAAYPETIEEIRTIKNLPVGYTLADTVSTDIFIKTTYVSPGYNDIIFKQYLITSTEVQADTEGVDLENLEIAGYPAVYFNNKGISTINWTDGKYGYGISGNLEKETLISMTELVSQK